MNAFLCSITLDIKLIRKYNIRNKKIFKFLAKGKLFMTIKVTPYKWAKY